MRWRDRWEPYVPRPKVAKLSAAALERAHATTTAFVAKSKVLRELIAKVSLARGRLYFWSTDESVMARITPVSRVTFLLEVEGRSGWGLVERDSLPAVLKAIERDRLGIFHGMGALAKRTRKKAGGGGVQETLRRQLGIPLPVLAEPRDWYAKRRKPAIKEVDADRGRALVRFESYGTYGPFHGTCLYARIDGEWGCYIVTASAEDTIASAEAWLAKHGWENRGYRSDLRPHDEQGGELATTGSVVA
jgi:hypothetical protein